MRALAIWCSLALVRATDVAVQADTYSPAPHVPCSTEHGTHVALTPSS